MPTPSKPPRGSGVYAIGVLASVYHLANGLWTMGITWGCGPARGSMPGKV